jgi:triphosphatase
VATETELKLLAAPADLDRLRRLPWLRAVQVGRARTRTLHSTYFDTPDGKLRGEGVGLRLRSDGRKLVQTLKTAGDARAGSFVRGEWEAQTRGPGLDAAALAATPLAPLFDEGTLAGLRPLLETEVTRTELRVTDGGAEMLLAFDRGAVAAGRRRTAICELEIELLDGPARAMFDLARRLAAEVPLAVGHVSKLERGLRLLNGAGPQPCRWPGSPLRPGMTAAEALQAIAASCIGLLAANAEAVLSGDVPEAVHQGRVALRRLRSAIGLFKPLLADDETAAVRDELRWLLQQLGPARDVDVFLSEILAPVEESLPEEPALALLRRTLVRQRRAHAAAAKAALCSARLTALMLSLGAWIEGGSWLRGDSAALQEPVEETAVRFIEARERKLRKRVRRLAEMDPAERHRVRIQVKRLRYACEFFLPVLPGKRGRRTVAALSELQDRLGLLNDLTVAAATLGAIVPDRHARLHRAAGLVEGWHAARAARELHAAEKAAGDWLALPCLVH